MATRKDIQPFTDETNAAEQKASPDASAAPTEPAKTERPDPEPPKIERPASPMPKIESPRLAPELKADSASLPPIPPENPLPHPRASETSTAPAARADAAARSGRFALLAASVAISAALGSVAGALGSNALARLLSAPAPATSTSEVRALADTIAQLGSDLASVKANLESTNRLSNTQFTRLGEKLDRAERAQTEPASRIAKIAESVERLERRSATTASATPSPAPATYPEATGSIADPAAAGGLTAGKSAIVDGWVLRDIYRGRALVEGRSGIIFEVGPGSTIPGVGRVENITRHDGRWIVVTQKGLIVSMR